MRLMCVTMSALLFFSNAVLGEKPPPRLHSRPDLAGAFEAEVRNSRDTNAIWLRQFEEILNAQGFRQESVSFLMSKFADAESECQDDKDETIAGCKLVQFRFVKKMINGQTVRYLVGEGEIQANSRPPEIRGIQIERQGLSIDTRKLEQEP